MQNKCFIATTEAEDLESPCRSAAQEKEVHPGSVHYEIYLRLPFPAFVSLVHVEIKEIRLILIYGDVMPSVCVVAGMLNLSKQKDVLDCLKNFSIGYSCLSLFFLNINKLNA